MESFTLREAALETGMDLCQLVSLVVQDSWRFIRKEKEVLIPEQELLKHNLRKESYTLQDFKKLADKYSGEAQELEEIADILIENKRYDLLFVKGMEEIRPIDRLLREGEYELLYLLFEEDETIRRKVIPEFGANEPLLAAEVGAQYQDWELIKEALRYTSIKTIMKNCPSARANSGWLSREINSEMLSEATDYLDQAKEVLARMDPSAIDLNEAEKLIQRTKNMEYREMLGLVSRIRRAVSEEMGIKLPSTVRFSEPDGSYGSIGYDREELYHEHDLRMQPEA
ncbi:hypothetical protein HZC30_07440 [Candidatus Woesearchaeota archaeon]|nr:hypothetical protein [Candidatus Woesearchaeota archaeon]